MAPSRAGRAGGPAGWTGAVLTGGASARMGRDKALVEVDGMPMAVRVARALEQAGASDIFCVGGERARAALEARGLTWVADDHPGAGPLGGVLTALRHARHDVVVVLACDLVAPSVTSIERLVTAAAGHPLTVPEVDGREQWLHAAWSVRGCRDTLEAAYARGERSVHGAASRLAGVHRFVDDRRGYEDADRPGDLPAGR